MKSGVIRAVIQRIDGWLTREPVFCYDTGAVAGLTNGNDVVYWYGEIAGYYLSYLASLEANASNMQKLAPLAAERVGKWLRQQWINGPAATRVYPCSTDDWRNDHVFAFDSAMILRGLTAARIAGFKTWSGRQIAETVKSKLVDDLGNLRATSTGRNAPIRWSTGMDGHQLKTAAGLMAWASWFQDPGLYSLGENAAQSLSESGFTDWLHLPLHPRLYALEGALFCGLMTPDSITRPVNKILAGIDISTMRTDVCAQLLRLALLSRITHRRIGALVLRLLDSVDTDGSVVFRADQDNDERNSWCAIFARQALSFFQRARRGEQLRPETCI